MTYDAKASSFCLRLALLLFVLPALRGQTVNSVPGFLQDLAGQWPLAPEFSLEQQIQIGTQGNFRLRAWAPISAMAALRRHSKHYPHGFSKLHLLFHRAGDQLLQTSGVARHLNGHPETTIAGKGTV
jgi:hypothetical protein